MDAKAKTARQTSWLVRKSDAHCLYSFRPLKYEESKNPKDFKAKKNYFPSTNNNGRNGCQSS